MKVFVGIALFIAFSISAFTQPIKSPPKTLVNVGASGLVFYEITMAPMQVDTSEISIEPYLSLWTTSFTFRRSLFRFSDNASIGIMASPSLGLTMDNVYEYFDLRADLPISVGYNWGAAATNRSISTRGFAWNFGVNIMKASLLNSSIAPILGITEIKSAPQLMVCSSIHYRYWTSWYNEDGECREIELFFGINPKTSVFEPLPLEFIDWSRAARVSLNFRRYLNY